MIVLVFFLFFCTALVPIERILETDADIKYTLYALGTLYLALTMYIMTFEQD